MSRTAKKLAAVPNEDPNPRAVSGNNQPPEEMSAFDAVTINLNDLYDEAIHWLDGEPVTTQKQADALNTLITRIRAAADAVEEQRVKEKTPHDTAITEIQDRYNPFLANMFSKNKTSGKAKLAIDAAKKALQPYLDELDRKQREEAQKKRDEADRLRQAALDAMQNRDVSNLANVEQAEQLVKDAKQADVDARRAENAKPQAKGEGRAIGLKTTYRAVIVDPREAAAWAWTERNEEIMAFVQSLADKAVHEGSRKLRGFDIVEEKKL